MYALVLFEAEQTFLSRLEAALAGITVVHAKDAAIDPHIIQNTEIIFGNPEPKTLGAYKALKWIQLQSAGTEGYDRAALGAETTVTNATGAYGHAIAEHIVACVFSLYKRLHQYRDEQNKGRWMPRGTVKSIKGSLVLVVGLGNIGGEFAQRMKALGSSVIGVRRIGVDKPDFVDELVLINRLDEVLPRADIVALCLPGTSGTKGLFNRERLALMKRGAVLVNIGRGSAVDTDALCDSLESGALGGAALDVTDPEPLPLGHKLWRIENVIITPHVSGGFSLRETYEAILSICIENAVRYKAGKPLMNTVDLETGYRTGSTSF